MLETVDPFVDFKVDPTLVVKVVEIVFRHKLLWNNKELDLDVFGAIKRGA